MRLEVGKEVAPADVEPEQEHAEHARVEHQQEATHELRDGEDDVGPDHVQVAAGRERCRRVHQELWRRVTAAGWLRRDARHPGTREHQRIQHNRQQEHRTGPSQHRSIVLAQEGHQRKSDDGVDQEDVAHPDQERVDEADDHEADQSPFEQARRISAAGGGALHEHREPDAEQQRKQRVELGLDQEQDHEVGGRMPVRERERTVMIRREEREPGHRDDVREQNPENSDAAHRVERIHALATHDRSGDRFTKHRHG